MARGSAPRSRCPHPAPSSHAAEPVSRPRTAAFVTAPRTGQTTNSRRLPQGSSTKNRVVPGISAGSAHRAANPPASSRSASRSSSRAVETRNAGWAFVAAAKRSATPDVQLLVADAEPDPAAHGETERLRDLLEPEERAVEAARRLLAADRRGDLDVVEGDDRPAHGEKLGVPRDPGPEKRTRFSRWVPCRISVKPSSGRGLPSCRRWFT